MRALATTLLCLVQLGGSLLQQAAAADNSAASSATSICRRDPTRPGCETPITGSPPPARAANAGQAAASRTGNCLTDPSRPVCDAAARRATVEATPAERFSLQKNVTTGAAAGAVGGTMIGLATCGPFLFGGPPAYGLCAATGMVLGLLGGGLAGGVADGIANFESRSAVRPESASRLNPVEQATNYERVASNGPTFEELRGRTEQAPQNNAIAVAVDAGQWAWGTASAAATEDQAKGLALHRCREQAGLKGVANPCAIYSVNGQAIFFDPK